MARGPRPARRVVALEVRLRGIGAVLHSCSQSYKMAASAAYIRVAPVCRSATLGSAPAASKQSTSGHNVDEFVM